MTVDVNPARGGCVQYKSISADPPAVKPNWKSLFFVALAETSNIADACTVAGVSQSKVYALRRRDPGFAEKWAEALCEGYDNLELEVLHRLRSGKPDDAKYNYTAAVRLLARHRDTVSQHRAQRAHVSAAEVRATIDRKIAEMRALLLAQDRDGAAER